MANLKIVSAVVILMASLALAAVVHAKDEETKPSSKAKKEFTKEELATHIKETLDKRADILGLIQGIKKETDPSGKTSYSYLGDKLESMDKVKLQKLLNRINGEISRINNERLMKQMESIRQAEQATRAAQQASNQVRIPQPPPQPPVVNTPPNVTQPPRQPAPPPAPPRR